MSWIQISIDTTKDDAQTVEDCLFSAGAQTVTLTDAADQPILEPAPDETPVWNRVVVTGLYSSEHVKKELVDEINACLTTQLTHASYQCSTQILEDKNWTRAWMEHFHAMQFGDRLWVCPLHLEPPKADAINLRLDPGLAFGTGTHPTTALCLRWLDENITTQNNILDYGCGSGILAIAACMLGASHADGVDIDPQALTATHNNAETNFINDKIQTFLPNDFQKYTKDTTASYDVVVANILSGPLAELAPLLASHTRINGHIVLSGILKEQAKSILKTYCKFFTMDKPRVEDDWVLLHGTKKSNVP
ncbi:MAG: 50S ribosomal protein L11 methyltransferase [Gammaproteobacteria bacterium]|nr:50S ribosomal protein L11 methyltransferase [Gammaproteobacteria bacterium]